MRKIALFFLAICGFVAAQAQELPYSKYLNFSKSEFKENKFKYDDYTNTWSVRKMNGLTTTVNILAILADAYEEVRPSSDDYTITIQLGEDDKVADITVYFYKDDIYHKILTFLKENCQDLMETTSGKLVKHKALYNNYSLELNMEQHIISRTSSRTADSRTLKNVDESYNEYTYTISTGVKPASKYLDKQATKKAKREAKGKKKDLNDMM